MHWTASVKESGDLVPLSFQSRASRPARRPAQRRETSRMADEERDFAFIAPLLNFRLDSESMQLADDTQIVRVMGADYRHLADNYHFMPEYNEISVAAGACTHAIKLQIRGTRDGIVADQTNDRKLEKVLSALRLHQRGRVGTYFTLVRDSSGESGWLRHPHIRSFYPTPPTYDLITNEAAELTQLLDRLNEPQHVKNYDLALRRFERTYERLDPEDRLIDLWVALEAIYANDSQTELSYRISLRIAHMLSEGEDRRDLFRSMRASYATRSAIVHGSRPKNTIADDAEATEQVVRTSLRAALTSDWPSTSSEMDELIF